MFPPRATRPIWPEPGTISTKFSSRTTLSAEACTDVMPYFGASPFCTMRMPFMPLSVEPIASVITT